MRVTRTSSVELTENKLPDGSRILVDSRSERVIALNDIAGAAWDACSVPTDLTGVTQRMRDSLGLEVPEEIAEEAIAQLQEKNLIESSTELTSRRAFIPQLAAIALPVVAAMTMTEQRAYAKMADSSVSKPTLPVPIFPWPIDGFNPPKLDPPKR